MTFNMPNLRMPQMPQLVNTPAQNTASEFYKRIKKLIIEFDEKLSETETVGASLGTFGQTVTFNITGVGYSDPSLILFTGTLEDGNDVTLVQHVTQISFLLIAMKRKQPELPKRRIGFLDEVEC